MKCLECGGALKSTRKHVAYGACGLPGVVLGNVEVRHCPKCGEQETVIPRIMDLHRKLAEAVVLKPGRLTGDEIRFARKFLGWSGQDFARHAGVKPETVSRWENDREPMAATGERFLRLAVAYYAPVEDYPIDSLDLPDKGRNKPLALEARIKKNHWKMATA